MTTAANAVLVERVVAGDQIGWVDFVDRYERLVWHIVRSSGAPPADSEDVVQVTFMRLFEALARLDDPARLTSFVAGVARNTSLESSRRRRRDPAPTELSEVVGQADEAADAHIESQSDTDAALEGLAHLKQECRQLLRLFFGADLSADEVGEALGATAGTVRVRKSRCLDKLRDTEPVRRLLGEGEQ